MKKLHLFGCSFTQRVFTIDEIFNGKFQHYNHSMDSANNFFIFKQFEEKSTYDSICIVQWSSLTRPMDENFSLLETSDNPLFDLLEQWYQLVERTQEIAKERNIKLIQIIGWAEWKDEELNEYHRNKLKSLDIQWFRSSPQWDLISSNCFQFQQPNEWSSNENEKGLYYWDELIWGGISEWCRDNIKMEDRYTYIPEEFRNGGPEIDPHPSPLALKDFYQQVIFPQIT